MTVDIQHAHSSRDGRADSSSYIHTRYLCPGIRSPFGLHTYMKTVFMFTDRAASKEGISPTTTPSPPTTYGTHNTTNGPYVRNCRIEHTSVGTCKAVKKMHTKFTSVSSYKNAQQDNSAPNRARRAESSQGVPPHAHHYSSVQARKRSESN